jgi:hypothetical protein
MDLKTVASYNDKDMMVNYLKNNTPSHKDFDLAFEVAIKNKNINLLTIFLRQTQSICCNVLLKCFMSNDERIIDLFLSSEKLYTERFYYRYNFSSLLHDIMLGESWKFPAEIKKKEMFFYIDDEYLFDDFVYQCANNNWVTDIRLSIFEFLKENDKSGCDKIIKHLLDTDARINLIYVLTDSDLSSRDEKDEKLLYLIRKKGLSSHIKDKKMFEFFPKSSKALFNGEKMALFLSLSSNDNLRLKDIVNHIPNKLLESYLK